MKKAHADLKENYALAAIYISQLEEEREELLEALRAILDVHPTINAEWCFRYQKSIDKVKSAIKKAEGKP
jgi:hypothetical protein